MIAALLFAAAVTTPAPPPAAVPCQKPLLSLTGTVDGGPLSEAAPAPVPCGDGSSVRLWRMSAEQDRGNLYRQPSRCGSAHKEVVAHVRTATAGRRPVAQYAVMREVDGCAVPAPVGYKQDYLLPGKADPYSTPAKPAGEPPRRR